VTGRAILIGLVLTAGLAWLTPYNDYKVGATLVAGNYLPVGCFFLLTLLAVGLNPLLRAVWPRAVLRPGELITIWCLTATASSIPASGLMRFLIPHIVAGDYYATPENQWQVRVLRHLPKVLRVSDPDAVRHFFENAYLGPVPWALWFTPLLAYGVFALALYFSFFCLSVLLRKQWNEHERFTFPLVQLPVEVCQAPEGNHKFGPLWRSGPAWIAILSLTIIHTINGLHRFYPVVPQVPLGWSIYSLANRPWDALNGVRLTIYPLVIGFSYLLHNEVLLSLWFFYVFYRLELVAMRALGRTVAGVAVGYSYGAFACQQGAGVALALLAWTIWSGRGQLKAIGRRAFRHDPTVDDRTEGLSYRAAVGGWLFALGVMLAWLVFFGQNWGTAIATLLFGYTAFLVLAWMVAQGGVLFLQSPWSGAEMAVHLFGFHSFTPRGILVSNQIESIFMLDLREFTLPQLINAQKASDVLNLHRRRLLAGLAVAMLITLFIAGEESIRLPYRHGAVVGMYDTWAYRYSPVRPLNFLDSQFNTPIEATPGAWANLLGGMVGLWLVMALRSRWAGFPVHPVGFIFAPGYPLSCFWFAFFLGWLFKLLIVRYGGFRFYRQARPFFLGLIVGDVLNGGIWIIVGLMTNQAYAVLPG